MKISLIFILLLFILPACSSQKENQNSELAMGLLTHQLNNSAMERFQGYVLGSYASADSLEVSLSELNKALELEPNQIELYSNKAKILLELNRDDDAIHVLKQALTIKPNFAEAMATIGFLYEKKGINDIAQEWYQKALRAYDKHFEEHHFDVDSKVNKALLLFFTENKESAIIAFEKLKKEYPENEEVEFLEQFFTDFDKDVFLKTFYR